MAVEDKYVDSDRADGKLTTAAAGKGAKDLNFVLSEEVAAADDDGSVYRFVTLPTNLIPFELKAEHDSITSGTDYDIGFYKKGTGEAVIDKDALADGLDFSSAASNVDCLAALDPANRGKTLKDLLGTTETEVDLAITANTVGSAAGTIALSGTFLEA